MSDKIIHVFERCQSINIKPGFKVNDKGATEALIQAKVAVQDKDGLFSYCDISVSGANIEEATKKLDFYVTGLLSLWDMPENTVKNVRV